MRKSFSVNRFGVNRFGEDAIVLTRLDLEVCEC